MNYNLSNDVLYSSLYEKIYKSNTTPSLQANTDGEICTVLHCYKHKRVADPRAGRSTHRTASATNFLKVSGERPLAKKNTGQPPPSHKPHANNPPRTKAPETKCLPIQK